jgi:acetyl esterase/lipase
VSLLRALFGLGFFLACAGVATADFDAWDKNKDGKLTRNELPEQARPNFDRADKNKDGFLSREEDAAFRARPLEGETKLGANVALTAGIAYLDNDNPRQTLDLLLPKKRVVKALPLIVFIHGGAWRAGNKVSGRRRVAAYVNSGRYAGVTVGYRLSAEAKWPAQMQDCQAAIRWIRENAEKHGLNPDRIGVWGTSAGGHLVSMLAVAGDYVAPISRKDLAFSDDNAASTVTCAVNFFGPSELLRMNDFPSKMDHDAADSPESQLIGEAIQQDKGRARFASPIFYVTKGDIPILHAHGDEDALVPYDQSRSFHEELRLYGVESTLLTMRGGGHGFQHPKLDELVSRFFEQHLHGVEGETIQSQAIELEESNE